MKSSIIEKVLIVFISLALVLGFYFLNQPNFKKLYLNDKEITIIPSKKKTMDEVIKDYEKNYSKVDTSIINNKLTSILVTDDQGNIQSFVYNSDNATIVDIKDLFKKNTYDLFINKVFDLLSLKYATFVVDGIKDFPGDIIYYFKNNEVVVYFKNYVFSPSYNEDITLHVNYNEIDEYLNFKHVLDKEYKNENGFDYDSNKPTIAISFDDGPNNQNTMQILKVLEDYKMCATFFMVGNKMYNQEKILKSVLATHSEIGSHTYSHINMKRVSKDKVKSELDLTSRIYKDITGLDIKLVRPPYGAYTDDIIKNYNYSFILWNADTDDWKYKDTQRIVDYVLNNANDGNIILMHDSYATSVEAVKIVIPQLYARGIQVVSVSKLAELKNFNLENGKAYRYIK